MSNRNPSAHVERREKLARYMRSHNDWMTTAHLSVIANYFKPSDGYHFVYKGNGRQERCLRDLRNLKKDGIVESQGNNPTFWKIVVGK